MKKLVLTFIALTALLTGCGRGEKQHPCRIDFSGTPKGAKVLYNGKEVSTLPGSIQLEPGMYLFKISHEGFLEQYCNVVMLKDDKRKEQEIHLKPILTSVLIDSVPTGAKVRMGGELRGTTPLVINNLPAGKYSAQFEKSGFAVHSTDWELNDDRPKSVSVQLSSNVGKVSIKSNPEGAKILLNGETKGETPFAGDLEEGRYEFVFERPGYIQLKRSFLVKRDTENVFAVNLVPVPGILAVDSTPSGATVFQNNEPIGITPLVVREMPPGEYDIKVVKDGFEGQTRKITVAGGGKTEAAFVLGINTGGIDLEVRPAGTKVYLNEKEIGVVKPSETDQLTRIMEIRSLPPGEYNVMAVHKRGVPDRQTVKVTVNKGKITRPAPIIMWVANAEVKLKKEGRIEIGVLYSEGEDSIIFGIEPGVKIEYKKADIELKKLDAAE